MNRVSAHNSASAPSLRFSSVGTGSGSSTPNRLGPLGRKEKLKLTAHHHLQLWNLFNYKHTAFNSTMSGWNVGNSDTPCLTKLRSFRHFYLNTNFTPKKQWKQINFRITMLMTQDLQKYK